jgi:hypothetical protein
VIGLEFARPWWLASLAVPLLVWWLARRRRPPPHTPPGTHPVWREAAAGAPAPALRRRPDRFLLAALFLGAAALGGPRTPRAGESAWRVVVDRSPSMYLPHPRGGTRLERAWGLARAELERSRAVERGFVAFDGADFVRVAGADIPAAWLGRPWPPHPEPDWARMDLQRTLWVTDAEPASGRRRAGLARSGGDAVPGPAAVAADGALLVFDGRDLARSSERAAARSLELGPGVPPVIRELASFYAAERGLSIAEPSAAAVALRIAGPAPGPRVALRIARDGWEMDVRCASTTPSGAEADPAAPPGADFPLALRPWPASAGEGLVRCASGRIELAFDEASEPRGSPEAFALSWSALFDAHLAPPREVVEAAERLSAGEERVVPAAAEPVREDDARLEALLAGAAALLALCALARRPRVRSAPPPAPRP